MRPPLPLALCALMLLGTATATATAATNDRPTAGRFAGEHAFDGAIALTFARERGIGLYLERYSVKGTLRCPDGEDVAIDEAGRVTARTAARVKPDRTFRLSQVVLKLDGRFTSSKRVAGTIQLRTSACSRSGAFRATRK